MASTADALDIKEVLSAEDLPLERLHEVRREIHCHVDLRSQTEQLLADFGSVARKLSSENKAEVRRGTAQWLLGQSEQAAKTLEPLRASKEKSYVLGVSYLEAGRAADALTHLKEANDADSSDPLVSAAFCEAKIRAGKFEEAEGHVERLIKKGSARAWYLKGLLADVRGFHGEAMSSYEKALEVEPGFPEALFRLAYIMDMTGEDARALELYEQLRKMRPMHLNTLMNLGVLYEDRGDYERAVQCYQTVLDYFPTHARAQLYLKDARASLTMFYDEDAARREAKIAQVLAQPVAEISFSPRVRNALQKLGVNTLGDIVHKTEEELLGIPNFGRTSLRELKEFLSSKGLSLASAPGTAGVVTALDEGGAPAPEEAAAVEGPASDEVQKKNLSDFEWSGRIRKVFEKLNLVTVGDLLKKTEKDLLKSKNLGVTSIKEIRKKLGQLGVSMKPE
jgi:DNA-directed RNA polymerase subunit alpha